jgi:hypothetical protein
MPLTQTFSAFLASAESPWPGTETKTVLVCRTPKKDEDKMLRANEFLDKDGRICRWAVVNKK